MRIPNFQRRAWPMGVMKERERGPPRRIRHTLPNRVKTTRSFGEAKLTK